MTEVKRKIIDKFEVLSGMFLLVLLGLILITAGLSGEKIFLVVVGFFPTILTILVSLTMHDNYAKKNKLFWFIPTIIVGTFYLIGTNSSVLKNINIELLTGINFVISLIYVAIVFGLFNEKKAIITEKTQPIKHKEETIEDFINSIEDKSKALNFVVGRVYNKYHGGDLSIRDKLRIPAEWYNDFSNIGVGTNKINFNKLNTIITEFEIQLKKFEKTESELFKNKSNSLKNLIREPNGSDKIIDVLDHNDKDPVRSYYQGAIDFCKKIRDSMKNQKIKLVKNTYIPTKEEDITKIKEKQKETTKSTSPKVTVEEHKGPKHP